MASSSITSEGGGGMANLFNPAQVVTIHIPQDPAESLPLLSSCFLSMGTESERFQASAYFCSILTCFFPGLINDVCDALSELGVSVTTVTSASERRLPMKADPTSVSVPESLVFLGQAVLVLYKNAQDESVYRTSMEVRINRLRAHSGVPSSAYIDNRISFEKAETIRSTLGSSFGLKKRLLEMMMDASAGEKRSNMVCSYLCDAIAWSGMTAIAFIYHALWNPRSLALKEASLQVEVRNLEEAFQKITAVDHPKYFNILTPPHETKIIQAYRFPTIIALAKIIISKPATYDYLLDESPRLIQLKKIHDQSPTQAVSTREQAAMQYNIEIEDEFVEEVMAYGLSAEIRYFKDIEEYVDDLWERQLE